MLHVNLIVSWGMFGKGHCMLQPFEPSNPEAPNLSSDCFFKYPCNRGDFSPLRKGALGEGMPPKSNSEWKALHLHLWKKGKKQGKGAKVWLQMQASSGGKKKSPLTKKRKRETSGWMTKKKATPPRNEGNP